MKPISVLSCFDGMSCGQIALERACIPIASYHSFEIDKYAIKITQKNYPDTVQLGDINNWREWINKIPMPNLIIAGSPCQGFSNAGHGLNFEDPRSKLFFVFCDILNHFKALNPNLKFLLENVKMKQAWQDIISDKVELKPALINSALVSAQNRQRLYWANWEFGQPEDKHIYLKDIIEPDEMIDKKYIYTTNHAGHLKNINQKAGCLTAGAHSGGNHSDMTLLRYPQGAAIRNQVTKRGVEEQLNIRKDGKSNCVVPSYTAKLNGIVVKTIGHGYMKEEIKERNKYPSLAAQDPSSKYLIRNKSKSLRVGGRGSPPESKQVWDNIYTSKNEYRKLTVLECERLQTVPEGYTEGVSNTQRYKMLGNGWTIDVLAHIFKSMI